MRQVGDCIAVVDMKFVENSPIECQIGVVVREMVIGMNSEWVI
jgi:hypothetical protein